MSMTRGFVTGNPYRHARVVFDEESYQSFHIRRPASFGRRVRGCVGSNLLVLDFGSLTWALSILLSV